MPRTVWCLQPAGATGSYGDGAQQLRVTPLPAPTENLGVKQGASPAPLRYGRKRMVSLARGLANQVLSIKLTTILS